ncbi:glycosyltransferase family 39 protein [Mycobacteroides abscessus]|uniref:glycosyltransferase family 39 protein n=1 Tax=Mycobacteroides abscessus TaxID=36809 RepID=UPI00148FAB29|nr:glycosyl transferase [Mycobacteroides abscessus]
MLTTTAPEAAPRSVLRERITLCALLVGTATLYLWNLSANGWANQFYAAAVQAGSASWKAFVFGSSDAANSITVDKPPLFLWPMELSVRLFGFSPWSMLVPQAVIGVAAVALLWWTVRRNAGPTAALIAGLVLALVPIYASMCRYNNPEPMMLLLMVASVWAVLEAVRDGRSRWLVLSGACVGLGFLTKQLEALIAVPALAATYLWCGPPPLSVRTRQLGVAAVAAVLGGGWWVALAELWPASSRPWIGGSPSNSFLELTFGYNGLDRITGKHAGHSPMSALAKDNPLASQQGFGRMFSAVIGGQISWLLAAALVLTVVMVVLLRKAPRTDPERACAVAFGGWLVVVWLLFDFMTGKGGMFSPYYTVALAPAIAAQIGLGTAMVWRHRETRWARWLCAALVFGTGMWAVVVLAREPEFVPWLRWVIAASAVLAAAIWVSGRCREVGAATTAVAVLAGPFAFCVDTTGHGTHGGLPLAGPTAAHADFFRAMRQAAKEAGEQKESKATPALAAILMDAPKDDDRTQEKKPAPELTEYLEHDAGRFTWMAAAVRSNTAAPYQLTSHRPVLPVGGFTGRDPFPALAQFQDYVARHQIHLFVVERVAAPPEGGDRPEVSTAITEWVERTFTPRGFHGVAVFDLTSPAPVPAELTATVPSDP